MARSDATGIRPRPAGHLTAVWAIALCAVAGVRAEPSEKLVQIRGHGGPFASVVRNGVWAERTVTVANRSDKPRRIMVALRPDEPDKARGRYTRTATLPPHAVMRLGLVYREDQVRRIDKKPGAVPLAEILLYLLDADTGVQLDKAYRLVTPVADDVTCIGGVGTPREDHDETRYLENLGEGELGKAKNIIAAPPPDRWCGYSLAGIVRLDEGGAADMTPSRRQALLDWVRRGGVLVILGGHEAVESLSGPWGQAAGVTPVGSHRVGRLAVRDPAGLGQFEPVELSWPLPMVELCCTGAQVVYEANGLPLLTRRALGDGWIFTLAVPTGALKDKRLHDIWRSIARTRRQARAVDADTFTEAGLRALEDVSGRRGPTRKVVALLLVVPIVLVLAVYLLARRGRRELAWWVLVPTALLMAAGMAWVSLARTDPPRLTHIGLITGLGDNRARRQGYYAIYSGPRERRLTFTTGGERGLIRPAGRIRSGQFEIRTGPSVSLPDRRVEVRNTRAFLTDTVTATEGLAGTMTFDAHGLTGTLTNRLTEKHPIVDAVLYANRRTYKLRTEDGTNELWPGRPGVRVTCGPDDLLGRVTFIDLDRQAAEEKRRRQPSKPPPRPPGRPTTRRRPRPATRPAKRPTAAARPHRMLGRGEFTGSLQHSTTDRLRNALVGRLVSAPRYNRTVGTQPALIGYTAETPGHPLAATPPGMATQGWSVVVWPIRLVRPEPGQRVTVPAGLVDMTYGHVGAPLWDPTNEQFNRDYRPGELLVYARAPVQVGRLEDVELLLRVRMMASGYQLDVRGLTSGHGAAPAGATELTSVRNPRDVVVRVPNAGRFRDAEGRFALSLRVRRLSESIDLGGGPPDVADSIEWAFQTIDVTLKGTCR